MKFSAFGFFLTSKMLTKVIRVIKHQLFDIYSIDIQYNKNKFVF